MPSSGTTIADMYGRGCLAHGDCSAARGITDQEEATLPRRTTFLEGGLALFPRADQAKPDTLLRRPTSEKSAKISG